jgi:hypothetical protein
MHIRLERLDSISLATLFRAEGRRVCRNGAHVASPLTSAGWCEPSWTVDRKPGVGHKAVDQRAEATTMMTTVTPVFSAQLLQRDCSTVAVSAVAKGIRQLKAVGSTGSWHGGDALLDSSQH